MVALWGLGLSSAMTRLRHAGSCKIWSILHLSHSLNSFKGDYVGAYMGDYYRGYEGGYI